MATRTSRSSCRRAAAPTSRARCRGPSPRRPVRRSRRRRPPSRRPRPKRPRPPRPRPSSSQPSPRSPATSAPKARSSKNMIPNRTRVPVPLAAPRPGPLAFTPLPRPQRAQAPRGRAPPVAQPSLSQQIEDSRHHFEQGVALYNDGDFSGALAEFEGSYKAHPTVGVLYNIGLTLKALRRYTDAMAKLSQYLAEDKKLPAERRNEVQRLIPERRAL